DLLLELLFIAGVVPDLQRNGDGENGREVECHPGQGMVDPRRKEAEDAGHVLPAQIGLGEDLAQKFPHQDGGKEQEVIRGALIVAGVLEETPYVEIEVG